jgi:hypothetical protein
MIYKSNLSNISINTETDSDCDMIDKAFKIHDSPRDDQS